MNEFAGQIVDVRAGRIFPGRFRVSDGKIQDLHEDPAVGSGSLYLPGLVDAHIHVESSMLAPTEFGRAAAVHGTVATVSDPHEIANVCGVPGVDWMIQSADRSPLKIFFGAPSCVPATPFETAGASFGPEEIGELLDREGIRYLSEVMNFPAVIGGDPRMKSIVQCALDRNMPVDGHAPGVIDEGLKAYAAAGIQTDHECVTLEEGRQRIALGMKVAIREGSAARNFDALWPLLLESPDACFLCSDDRHPDDLIISQIDGLIRRALENGVPPMNAIRAATCNPVRHYGLPVGSLRNGDPADFISVPSLEDFRILGTWIAGEKVAGDGQPLIDSVPIDPINRFSADPLRPESLRVAGEADRSFATIVAKDGQLMTERSSEVPTLAEGRVVADPERDLLKIVVVNRYEAAPPSVGLIRNFGLREGAIAGSVAHDSHNVVAVGADDESLARAINAVIREKGGLSFSGPGREKTYPLPVAGLMGVGHAWEAASAFEQLTQLAKDAGCGLRSPYMTLSFMPLLVIPSLKIGDKGLFDVGSFSLVEGWE